jgi:N-acetylglucosaminyldiphosphoundecaprenol N-acetyl-beta-D-mannosaminyltransferase
MPALTPTVSDGPDRVRVAGVKVDALTENQVVEQVIASLLVGRGGWIATPNVNFLRRASSDLELASLLSEATLRVADGMPLSWASRLARAPQLHRVTGASLVYSLSSAAARYERSVYILGGPPGAAVEAAANLQAHAPGLRIVGSEAPWLSADVTAEEVEPIVQRLEAAKPDIVFCGFGFPKQERLIAACRSRLPSTWFLGCGAAVNFAAGHERRAPRWMQRSGLEWLHRMSTEPRRLAGRYLADIPFAVRLLLVSGVRSRYGWTLPASVAPFPDEIVIPSQQGGGSHGIPIQPVRQRATRARSLARTVATDAVQGASMDET